MKKISSIIVSLVICCVVIMGLTGCSKPNSKDPAVKELQSKLTSLAETSSEKYFDKKINSKDFDVCLGSETKPNEFENIETLEGIKTIYLTEHFNGEPKDVTDVILVYDVQSKKMIKFGVRTLKDDNVVYANLKE